MKDYELFGGPHDGDWVEIMPGEQAVKFEMPGAPLRYALYEQSGGVFHFVGVYIVGLDADE